MRFRRDIEGLRAFAVVPVILFHARVPMFDGGFVGVDIFFVISGFLITSLILSEQDAGNFSLLEFYQRRARRILPALFTVMAFSLLAGWGILMPADFRSLALSVMATALFISNILFWRQSGYFDAASDEKPLLHTWSLAVEEQFYATFPLYLWLAKTFFPNQRTQVTAAVFLISLLSSIFLTPLIPSAAFYLAPTRVWELMIGALLALGAIPAASDPRIGNAAGVAGAGLVAFSILLYSQDTPFPGVAALAPTIGAGLIIWSGRTGSIVSRVLQRTPFVYVGRISYSLYLWHFPLLAYAHYVSLPALSFFETGLILIVTAGLSLLSWRFIEQPFRNRAALGPRQLLIGAAAVSFLFIVLGASIYGRGGFPERLSPSAALIAAGADDIDLGRAACFQPAILPANKRSFCPIGHSAGPPQFVLWGDSFAQAMSPGVEKAAVETGTHGIFAGYPGCLPIMGVNRDDQPKCRQANDAIMEYIRSTPSVRAVILDADWATWAEGQGISRRGNIPMKFPLSVDLGVDSSISGNHAIFAYGLRETISALHSAGKAIWLVGPLPEIGYAVPKALYLQAIGFERDIDIRVGSAEFAERQKFVNSTLRQIAKDYSIALLEISDSLCDPVTCAIEKDGRPLYVDGFHLSRFGAEFFSPLFEPALRTLR